MTTDEPLHSLDALRRARHSSAMEGLRECPRLRISELVTQRWNAAAGSGTTIPAGEVITIVGTVAEMLAGAAHRPTELRDPSLTLANRVRSRKIFALLVLYA